MCEKCYNNKLLEINSVESQENTKILGNTVYNIEKKNNSSLITINCEIELAKEHKIQTMAMIDTGSTKSVIREELVPEKYRQKLAKPIRITQFDEILVYLTHCINNESIKVEKQQFNLPLTFVSLVGSYPFILGLNFLKSLQGFLFMNPNITFFKR